MFKDIRCVFMGTPEFACPILDYLIDEFNVVGVVCQKDKEVGRHRVLMAPPIKRLAISRGIDVYQINLRKEYDDIVKLNPDIIVTCAFGQIVPSEILKLPRLGCINVHASYLPKLRGGAPIEHAIIDGYDKTGVSIMYMDESLDTGNIISQKEIFIEYSDTFDSLEEKIKKIGLELLKNTMPSIINGTCDSIKQDDELATFAKNISREDEHIDFNNKAIDIYNKVRGLYSNRLAYVLLNDIEVKVLEVCIGDKCNGDVGIINKIDKNGIYVSSLDNYIIIKRIKPSGKKEMDSISYVNGIGKDKLLGVRLK